MVNLCGTCTRAVTPSTPSLRCNSCKKFIHVRCTSLSPSEISFINNIISNWKCDNCSEVNESVDLNTTNSNVAGGSCPHLRDDLSNFQDKLMSELNSTVAKIITEHVEKLMTRIVGLEKEVDLLKNKVNNLTHDSGTSSNIEQIVNEVSERNKRSTNLIIFAVNEENVQTISEQQEHERGVIAEILSALEIPDKSISGVPMRLGKPSTSHLPAQRRPIEIRLSSIELVEDTLRRSPKLKKMDKWKTVFLCKDRTPTELQYIKKTKNELANRLALGETNLQIKYRNNVPKIVNVLSNSSSGTARNRLTTNSISPL